MLPPLDRIGYERPHSGGRRIGVIVLGHYGNCWHSVVQYEAAQFPVGDPITRRVSLSELSDAGVSQCCTCPPSPGARRSMRQQWNGWD